MRAMWMAPLILMGCGFYEHDEGRDMAVSSRGSVCGENAIKGEVVGRVDGSGAGCGIDNAVKVTSVGGVALSQPSVMECNTARQLNGWVTRDMDRIVGLMGGGVQEIEVAAHYACRTRNGLPGGKLSEHAKGRAIDISGFRLRDGETLSVEEHWDDGRRGRMLSRLHATACGPFGTVLGPKADRFHQDHFHFDTASHQSGAYCR